MRAIVNTAPGRLEMRELPLPQPGPGQVRIRTSACGICATDLEMIDGDPRTAAGAVLGHEWSGVVDAVGAGVAGRWVGKRCVGENVLADGGEVGFEHPGGYGKYFVTEARRLHALDDAVSADVATLIEPLAVCVRALRRLGRCGEGAAVVFGDGPIGLILVMLLRLGARERVLLVGGREGRLALGRALGAGGVLNYHAVRGDLAAAVRGRLGHRAASALEVSGNPEGMAAAMRCVREEGRVLVLGDYGRARADFAWHDLLRGQLTLVGSNASAGAWPEAVRLAAEGHLPLERIVTHRVAADRFAEGMALARGRGQDVVKVVLTWGDRLAIAD